MSCVLHFILCLYDESELNLSVYPRCLVRHGSWFFITLMQVWRRFKVRARSEGFGNILVEAIGSRFPVISTRYSGGAVEVMKNGRLGPLVDVDDVDSLAVSMREVLDNPPDPEMLRASAQRFRTDVVARQYLEDMVS